MINRDVTRKKLDGAGVCALGDDPIYDNLKEVPFDPEVDYGIILVSTLGTEFEEPDDDENLSDGFEQRQRYYSNEGGPVDHENSFNTRGVQSDTILTGWRVLDA